MITKKFLIPRGTTVPDFWELDTKYNRRYLMSTEDWQGERGALLCGDFDDTETKPLGYESTWWNEGDTWGEVK